MEAEQPVIPHVSRNKVQCGLPVQNFLYYLVRKNTTTFYFLRRTEIIVFLFCRQLTRTTEVISDANFLCTKTETPITMQMYAAAVAAAAAAGCSQRTWVHAVNVLFVLIQNCRCYWHSLWSYIYEYKLGSKQAHRATYWPRVLQLRWVSGFKGHDRIGNQRRPMGQVAQEGLLVYHCASIMPHAWWSWMIPVDWN